MKKFPKSIISLLLILAMACTYVMPASAAPVKTDAVEQKTEEVTKEVEATKEAETENKKPEKATEKTEKKATGSDVEINISADDFNFEVNTSANAVLVDALTTDTKIDEKSEEIKVVEEELDGMKVLDEETGKKVALTEEQQGQALAMYQMYLDQWRDNADLLGVQSPYYLNYNDTKDGLGTLGEMLVLAGVSVEDVRTGDYSFDDLIGMIMNFYYGDKYGLQFYGSKMKAQRDAALDFVKAQNPKTDEQKFLALTQWIAQNDSFDMAYIMNADDKDTDASGNIVHTMRSEKENGYKDSGISESQYKDIYNTLHGFYSESIGGQFHDAVYGGIKADLTQKFWEGTIQNMILQGALAQIAVDPENPTEEELATANGAVEQQMTQNKDAIAADAKGFAKAMVNDDAIFAQIEAQETAFLENAEKGQGVEVAPGIFMTVEDLTKQTMASDDPNQGALNLGTEAQPYYVSMNDAIPIYADGAASQLTLGIIGYWEGNQIGVFANEKSVCMGYAKAFAFLTQCLFPSIYSNGSTSADWYKTASNWKTATDLYYTNGKLDINKAYNVDLVRVSFAADVTMYGELNEGFNSDHFWNAVKVNNKWYYIDPCYIDVYTEVMNRDRVEAYGDMNHMYFLISDASMRALIEGNFSEIATLYQEAATDKSYEDSWVSRIKSNVYIENGEAYYTYDSTDMISLFDQYNNAQYNQGTYDKLADEMKNVQYKIVRHTLTNKDSGNDGDTNFTSLIDFNYRENEDSDEYYARIYNPKTKEYETDTEDAKLINKLFNQFLEDAMVYPSIYITSAVDGNLVYFALSNSILTYDINTGDVKVIKEYNDTYAKRDTTNKFGGVAFEICSESEYMSNKDSKNYLAVKNAPIAGITIEDNKLKVAVATNYAWVSGQTKHDMYKADGTMNIDTSKYGYEYAETNFNNDYNSYTQQQILDYESNQQYQGMMGDYQKELNDNDEFMWTAVFREEIAMSTVTKNHTYKEVEVDASCGRDAFRENRDSNGFIEDGSRVVIEDSASDHHYVLKDETYYTKSNGAWNKGTAYVCMDCGYSVEKNADKYDGKKKDSNGNWVELEKDDENYDYWRTYDTYDEAAKKAGHVYVGDPAKATWSEDYKTVSYSGKETCKTCDGLKADVYGTEGSINSQFKEITKNIDVKDVEVTTTMSGTCDKGLIYVHTGKTDIKDGRFEVSKTVEEKPKAHTFDEENIDAVLSDDKKSVTVTYTCTVCGTKESEVVEVTKKEGNDIYEAEIEINGHKITVSVDETIKIADAKVTLSTESYVYDGKEKTPAVTVTLDGKTLVQDQDVKVAYSDNKNVGTAKVEVTGIGAYSGKATAEFQITKAAVTIKAAEDVTLFYEDEKQTASVAATGCPDFAKVEYTSDNSNITVSEDGEITVAAGYVGKATITAAVRSTANYSGNAVTTKVVVNKLENTLAAKNITKVYKTDKQIVDIAAATNGEAPTYKSDSASVKVNSNGQITIAKKFVGSANIVITSEENNKVKAKSITIKVTVIPTKTSIKTVTNSDKKTMTVTWKKKGWTGYQIVYSTSKDFANYKKVNISKNKTVSKKIKKLTKGKKYYVKVRTYKTVNKVKYYSDWSAVKSVKIKK